MSKKFLVPLDGSKLAEQALPWAELLAEATGSKLELLSCYEPPASVYMLPDFAAPPPVYFDQASQHKEMEQYLHKTRASLPQGLATIKQCEGDAGMAILDRASSGEIEAIVMASHGRGGLGRWLLGSVATKIVRGSKIPVLVVNASTKVPPHPKVERILVPLDGSQLAEIGLEHALEIARAVGAEIRLYQGVPHTPIGNPTLDAAVDFEVVNAQEYLDKVKSRYPEARLSTKVKVAGPTLGIVEESEDCDLVVMSSHGRSGFRRWLLGSIAENVLQAIHKPLLIVYNHEHGGDDES